MPKPIYLVVIADDFGMCPSVNDGIVDTFRDGILTTTTLMPPCPAFQHAVELAHRTAIPLGVHLTLNADWDLYRWGSLTGRPSLQDPDLRMTQTKPAAQNRMKSGDLLAEMRAQVLAVYKAGLKPTHLDSHMGTIYPYTAELAAMVKEFRLPFRFEIKDRPDLSVRFDSPIVGGEGLSPKPVEKKLPWLIQFLETLKPGFHMLCGHPARPGPDLDALVSVDSDPELRNWAFYYRLSDRDCLLRTTVRQVVKKRGIRLINFSDMIRLQKWHPPRK